MYIFVFTAIPYCIGAVYVLIRRFFAPWPPLTIVWFIAGWLAPSAFYAMLLIADARGKSLANLIEPLILGAFSLGCFILATELRAAKLLGRSLDIAQFVLPLLFAFALWRLVPSLPE